MSQSFLEKISWKTRRWNYEFSLLNLHLHDSQEAWGFSFFEFKNNFVSYSLLGVMFRLPNKTTVKRFTIDDWDLLFMSYYLSKRREDLADKKLWNRNLTKWESIQLSILDRLIV